MTQDMISELAALTDAELLCGLQRLVRADRALSVQMLLHPAEVEKRGLFREQAYGSMFEYAV